jgi:hypothetical protein
VIKRDCGTVGEILKQNGCATPDKEPSGGFRTTSVALRMFDKPVPQFARPPGAGSADVRRK